MPRQRALNPSSGATSDTLVAAATSAAVQQVSPTIQAQVNAALAAVTPTLKDLASATGTLSPSKVGPFTINGLQFADVTAAFNYVAGLVTQGGATAPVPNAAPQMSFPGGSGDVGETVTITPGTYTGSTPTSVSWNVIVNGSIVQNVTNTNFVIPTAAGTGARALAISELYTWSGGTNVVGKTSTTATVNAPAAVPANTTVPSITGSAQVGQTLTFNAGSWTNSPTSYTFTLYSGGTPAQGGVAVSGPTSQAGSTLTFSITAGLAGATLVLGVKASNVAGASTNPVEAYSSTVVVSGGVAPSYDLTAGAVGPGWVSGVFQVGTPMVMDFGSPLNNPSANGYSYQVLRDGVAITGASASNVSNFATYTPVSADAEKNLSFWVTASNAGGTTTQTTAAAVTVSAAVGGSGGTGSFVGTTQTATGFASVASANLPSYSGTQSGDLLIIIHSNNGPAAPNAPTGGGTWNQTGSTLTSTAVGGGEECAVFWRIAGSSEPANYVVSAASTEFQGAILLVYRGPTTVTTSTGSAPASLSASPVTVTFPTVTTPGTNNVVVRLAAIDTDNTPSTSWTASGLNLRASMDIGTQGACLVVFDEIVAAAGATGTKTATTTLSAGNAGGMPYSIALS